METLMKLLLMVEEQLKKSEYNLITLQNMMKMEMKLLDQTNQKRKEKKNQKIFCWKKKKKKKLF